MTDLGTIALDTVDGYDDVDPVTFTFEWKRDGDVESAEFRAHGAVPFAWTVDYWTRTAGTASMLVFLSRVLHPDDWPRFHAILTDPTLSTKTSLIDTVHLLLDHYDTVEAVGPTVARSGGPARSPGGRSKSGRGSAGSRRVKAST